MLLKTRGLAQFLVEKKKIIDFNKPEYAVDRQDSDDVRQKKILNISDTDRENIGCSKGALHYMKKNAKAEKTV